MTIFFDEEALVKVEFYLAFEPIPVPYQDFRSIHFGEF